MLLLALLTGKMRRHRQSWQHSVKRHWDAGRRQGHGGISRGRSVGGMGAGWAFRVVLAAQVSEVTRIHAEVNGSGNTR